jgi:hypothetical protein
MAESFEAVEIFESAAVLAFGLGLIAEEDGPAVGLAGEAEEAFGETVIAILGARDFDGAISGEFLAHGCEGAIVGVESLVEGRCEEAGFEPGGAEDGLLGEGHAFEGEEFLRVDRPVDGDEVGLEASDFLEVFEADDGEGGGGEAVLDRVLCGAGLALRSLGAGGLGGVSSVGGELFGGGGFLGASHGVSDFTFTMRWEWRLPSTGVGG